MLFLKHGILCTLVSFSENHDTAAVLIQLVLQFTEGTGCHLFVVYFNAIYTVNWLIAFGIPNINANKNFDYILQKCTQSSKQSTLEWWCKQGGGKLQLFVFWGTMLITFLTSVTVIQRIQLIWKILTASVLHTVLAIWRHKVRKKDNFSVSSSAIVNEYNFSFSSWLLRHIRANTLWQSVI